MAHPPPNSEAHPSPERTVFVYAAITLAAALFIAIVALLYWRSTRNSAHTALLIIEADSRYDGAVVSVESPGGALQTKTLDPGRNYSCRFILPPGLYVARVQLQGRVIVETPLTRIGEFQTGHLPLKSMAIRPPPAP